MLKPSFSPLLGLYCGVCGICGACGACPLGIIPSSAAFVAVDALFVFLE